MECERETEGGVRKKAAATGNGRPRLDNGGTLLLSLQTLNLLTSIAPPTSSEAAPTARHLHWECGCGRGQNEVWLCCDEKGEGRLGVVSLDDKTRPHLEMTSCKASHTILRHFICDKLSFSITGQSSHHHSVL